MQPAPWLRPATTYSPYRIRSACQRDQFNRTASRNNKQTNERTNQPPTGKGERGESPSGGCVCIVGVDSPQPSSVTSVSSREAKPTRTKRTRRQRQKTQRSTTQTTEKAKPTRRGGKPTKPNRTEGSEADQTRKKRVRGEEGNSAGHHLRFTRGPAGNRTTTSSCQRRPTN